MAVLHVFLEYIDCIFQHKETLQEDSLYLKESCRKYKALTAERLPQVDQNTETKSNRHLKITFK